MCSEGVFIRGWLYCYQPDSTLIMNNYCKVNELTKTVVVFMNLRTRQAAIHH